jgi:hypothetical protein
MFVVRNIAALAPPYETSSGYHGVSAALEFAVTQLEVGEILVLGHGLCGGCAAALTGQFDETEPGYFDHNKLPCQGPPMRSLRVLGDRAAILYALNAARGPLYVMNGSGDTVMDMAHHTPEWFAAVRARSVALRGSERNMFTTVLYPGISHRTSWVNKDGVAWLHQQLRFAMWTKKDILRSPVTHVSEWAKANQVDIAKNFMREDREGGLEAVGTGFPGIKRQDLMVLPDADWLAMKDRLTYEAWAAKTLAAEQGMVAGAARN